MGKIIKINKATEYNLKRKLNRKTLKLCQIKETLKDKNLLTEELESKLDCFSGKNF